ncbi:MAG: nuclear transport factor 2 family protein [Bacteroidetes bacterium]|nr:nuclear transport factor 2 family protein [Bacteroidota bacterium]MBL0066249.1 nuclear transport factor 2 family protein [Bacteroidota bacterium]MBL0139101.1 nuclear transport factor 2 family protein [Bacteroidota bacterium]
MTHEEIAIRWFECFNTKKLDDLIGLYAENARHFSPKLKLRKPETGGWIEGQAALKAWWADAFQRLPSLRYEVKSLTANEQRIFMEYLRSVQGEEDMMIAEVLEIRDGKIQSSRVYHA